MEFVTTVEAREHFAELINKTAYGKERVVLTRRGKNLVAIIPLEDLNLIEALEDRIDINDAKAALKEINEKGSISLEEFKRKENIK